MFSREQTEVKGLAAMAMALQGAPAARLAQSIYSSGEASCALTSSPHSSVTASSSLSFPATGYSHVCAHSGASLSKESLHKWRPFSGTRIAFAGECIQLLMFLFVSNGGG